jgi:hypothetical protein
MRDDGRLYRTMLGKEDDDTSFLFGIDCEEPSIDR